ncbi:MAG: Ca2+-dependent phosphoinositide-specific phospholipase C [Bacteroidota bacterium]
MNGLMGAYFFRFFCAFIIVQNQAIAQDFSDATPLNQLRVLASHNSYKLEPKPKTLKFLFRFSKKLGESNDPKQLEYGHLSISEQCTEYHIRGLELDVYNDPKGGRYFKHRLNLFIRGQSVREKRYRPLKEPGFKVLHIPDVDYETNYLTLNDALDELNRWSLANPNHAPIFLNIEPKTSALGDESKILRKLGFKKAIPYSQADLRSLDSLIKSQLTTLYTPQEFRKGYGTLRERVDSISWPVLGEARGRIFAIIDAGASLGYPTNGAAFVYGNVRDSNCVFLIRNEPIEHQEEITELTQSFIVRTRADAGTLEARANNYLRLRAALLSGAQIISTDYYRADPRFGNYVVPFIGFVK